MTGLAVFSLLMLRSMVKAVPASPASNEEVDVAMPTLALDTEPDGEVEDVDDAGESGRPKLRLKKGPTLKDDLVEIVKTPTPPRPYSNRGLAPPNETLTTMRIG